MNQSNDFPVTPLHLILYTKFDASIECLFEVQGNSYTKFAIKLYLLSLLYLLNFAQCFCFFDNQIALGRFVCDIQGDLQALLSQFFLGLLIQSLKWQSVCNYHRGQPYLLYV